MSEGEEDYAVAFSVPVNTPGIKIINRDYAEPGRSTFDYPISGRKSMPEGFIIFDDYAPRYNEFATDMAQWIADGKIKYREQVVDGLDAAPQAFIGLLKGENFGKLVIQVSTPLAEK